MTQTAHELPTIQEELSRKAIDTLEELLRKEKQGKINKAQLDVALDTLFSTVSGMVDEEFIDLITLASDEVKSHDQSYIDRRLFVNEDDRLVVVCHPINSSAVTLLTDPHYDGLWAKVVEKDFSESAIPEEAAKKHAERIVRNLKLKGFKEL